jgi:hypothetical protein
MLRDSDGAPALDALPAQAGAEDLPGTFHFPRRMKQDIQVALDPPSLYLRAATMILRTAMGLFRAGMLSRSGLATAQDWSGALAELGLASWRRRRSLSAPPPTSPWAR